MALQLPREMMALQLPREMMALQLPREMMALQLPREMMALLPLLRHSSLQTFPILLAGLWYVLHPALSGMMKWSGVAIGHVPVNGTLQDSRRPDT